MAEGTAENGQKKREQRVESLGWITESSVMPKKHKAIEGVGASSILELKARLYRSQQEAKANSSTTDPAAGDYHHARKKVMPLDVASRKNSGVEARADRDKAELKAIKDGSAVYAALEKKAALYEKLSKGEVPDEEENEKYCVDFFQKSLVQSNLEQPSDTDIPTISRDQQEFEDLEANSVYFDAKPAPGRTSTMIDRDEHKRFVREVHEEVNQAREKASVLKQRRQEQEAARREKLKHAYLRKQLEKLKAANAGQL